jgi:hypothetical protein
MKPALEMSFLGMHKLRRGALGRTAFTPYNLFSYQDLNLTLFWIF